MTGTGPLVSPPLDSKAGLGIVGLAWLVGVLSLVGRAVGAGLAGIATLLRRRRRRFDRWD